MSPHLIESPKIKLRQRSFTPSLLRVSVPSWQSDNHLPDLVDKPSRVELECRASRRRCCREERAGIFYAPLRPHSHPGRCCERGRPRCLRITAYLAPLALRTLAQRCRCASAMRSRASLLRIRLPLLAPFALPRAANAFPTLSVSFWRREYSLCREETTLFRFVI